MCFSCDFDPLLGISSRTAIGNRIRACDAGRVLTIHRGLQIHQEYCQGSDEARYGDGQEIHLVRQLQSQQRTCQNGADNRADAAYARSPTHACRAHGRWVKLRHKGIEQDLRAYGGCACHGD